MFDYLQIDRYRIHSQRRVNPNIEIGYLPGGFPVGIVSDGASETAESLRAAVSQRISVLTQELAELQRWLEVAQKDSPVHSPETAEKYEAKVNA